MSYNLLLDSEALSDQVIDTKFAEYLLVRLSVLINCVLVLEKMLPISVMSIFIEKNFFLFKKHRLFVSQIQVTSISLP
jgi:hypothetical protein